MFSKMVQSLRTQSKSSNYPYVVARIKSKKRFLLKKDQYSKLVNMTLSEIALFMEETQYKKEIDDLSLIFSGVDLIEMALYRNMSHTFRDILSYCEGDLKNIVAIYLYKWDKENIKLILRGYVANKDPKALSHYVVPAGYMDPAYWDEALKIRDFNGLLDYFQKSEYRKVIQTWKNEIKGDISSMSSLEDMLDKSYYENLIESVKDDMEGSMILKEFFRRSIDEKNLITLLRMKNESIPYELARSRFIKYGHLKIEEIQKIYSMSISEIMDRILKDPFYVKLKEHVDLYNQNKDLAKLIRAIEKHFSKGAEKRAESYPLSPLPVFHYINLKWKEIDNIKTIARSIERGLPRNEIYDILMEV